MVPATLIGSMMFWQPAYSQVFSNLLSPVLQVWVRSQVQQVDDLQVTVSGPDSEVVNGRIRTIDITGRNVLYEGIPARTVNLRGTDIRLDTTGALRGGGLRLTQPVRADLALSFSEQDVNTYLASPTFQEQIRDLRVQLPSQLGGDGFTQVRLEIQNPRVRLQQGRMDLAAVLRIGQGEPAPIRVSTGIEVASPRQLRLTNARLVPEQGESTPIESLSGLLIELGEEVEVREVGILPGLLNLKGSFNIETTPVAAR